MNSTAFIGNLVADPELRTSQSGKNRATFRVAVNEGDRDKGTEKSHFIDVTAFGTIGENTVSSLRKGQRVLVIGRFDSYQTEVTINGEAKNINRLSFIATGVGPDLRWQTAQVAKVVSNGNGNDNNAPAAQQAAPAQQAQPAAAGAASDDF